MAEVSCSGASENASVVVDAKDSVSAVAVALRASGDAMDGGCEGKRGFDSCVGVVKVSVEVKEWASVGISAS